MTAAFDTWAAAVRRELAERGIDRQVATSLIEDVRAHCAQAGSGPTAVAGSPREFAAAVAVEQPSAVVAGRDVHGMTARGQLRDATVTLAAMVIPWSLLAAAMSGTLSVRLTPAGLIGAALFGLSWFTIYGVPNALRTAGHPRLAPWGYAVGGILVVATGVALVELPRTRLVTIPVLAVTASAALVVWLATRQRRAEPRSARQPSPADPAAADLAASDPAASGPAAADLAVGKPANGDPGDAGRWLARLDGLLIGRFDVPPARAAELVAEARSHLLATGARPGDEFGPVAQYARRLADSEPVRRGPWWRSTSAELLRNAVLTAVILQWSVGYLHDRQWWLALSAWVVAFAMAWSTAGLFARYRRERSAGRDRPTVRGALGG